MKSAKSSTANWSENLSDAADKTKEVASNAAASASEMAKKAASATVTFAEDLTGKDLNNDGKVGKDEKN